MSKTLKVYHTFSFFTAFVEWIIDKKPTFILAAFIRLDTYVYVMITKTSLDKIFTYGNWTIS